ncbi:MAG: tetratricopeptide repeat protein [Flavobacteriaceae bacterium]|nr:tetratricopeptide repeat protein [Flavobacteriaceae bacterium]
MKKIFHSFICLVLFNYSVNAQNDCFTLNSAQINLLEKPENKNSYEALQKLGLHYFQVSQYSKQPEEKQNNLAKAFKYFEKAYSNGQNESDFSKTAYYYGLANLKDKNLKLAFNYISKSANKEYLPAMFYLGSFYENGVGTTVDNKKSEKYYEKVASQFNPFQAKACDRLGRLYYHKLRDYEKSARWLIKAVNLGYTRATHLLLSIDDKYVKDISIYDEKTQRALGMKFNKDGELYEDNCNGIIVVSESKNNPTKTRHTLNPRIVSEKQDPVFPMTYYKKKEQIDFAKRSILESIGGKQINFSSGRASLYYPSLINDNPLLEEAYNFIKKTKMDRIYQIQKGVKSSYSFLSCLH